MATDRLAQTVREQLRLGRLLPLGGQADGAWLTEHAAQTVLGRAAEDVRGVRLGRLRIALADPDPDSDSDTAPHTAGRPAVPPPPSALPPGPLRIEAEFGATADEPLPAAAERLRAALLASTADRLGLVVEAVDLRVTEVLDELPAKATGGGTARQAAADESPEPPATPKADADHQTAAAAAATAAAAVPGVARLAPVLGFAGPVHIDGAHIRIELAVAAHHRALDVARAVRAAVAAAVTAQTPAQTPAPTPPEPTTVAVLVTAVETGH